MWDMVVRAKGPRVLVGGLGLGLLIHLLSLRRDIEEITVVEIQQEIIDMVKQYLPKVPKVEVIQGDFFSIMGELGYGKREFDTVICDIWKGRDEKSKELYEDCRGELEYCFPDAKHLFWAFQTEHETEESIVYGYMAIKDRLRKEGKIK